MIRALFYLRVISLRNQVRTRLGRLREPKYLAGALVAGWYLYFFFFRRLLHAPGGPGLRPSATAMGREIASGAAAVIVLILILGWVLFAWLAPSSKPALRFSPAEIDFLFPSPVTRRTLLHYSLLSSQLPTLFSATVFGLFSIAQDPSWSGVGRGIAGWWILLAAGNLHRSAANLTYAWLRERGADAARTRRIALGIVGGFLAAIALSLRAARLPTAADFGGGRAFAAYFSALLGTGGLGWLLGPFRLIAGPLLAPDGRAFLLALGPALLILAVHYRWILRLEVSFAEGSIALAEKRARMRDAAASGRTLSTAPDKAGREPFRLRPQGAAEVAFLWKNLISITVVNWRILAVAGVLLVQALAILFTLAAGGRRGSAEPAILVAGGAALLAFYVVLVGPRLARQDLRQDLANADLLKSYPLPGWRVVLGELLAPLAVLSGLLWVLLAAALWSLGLSRGHDLGLTAGDRLAAALGLAAVIPVVCGLELLACNAEVLYFPGWHKTTPARGGGLDVMGQRLIFAFAQLLVIAAALLPAVLAAALLIFASQWLIGLAPALILATAAVLGILGGECAVGLWLLGRRFETLDLTTELNP